MPVSEITGSISNGTLRSQDLITRFVATIATFDPAKAAELDPDVTAVLAQLATDDPEAEEAAGFLLEDLTKVLEEAAPEGYYFGAHEGDGADFGFWETDDEDDEPEPEKPKRKIRVVQDHMNGGKWQKQYYDRDMRLWFDIGDARTTRGEAEAVPE